MSAREKWRSASLRKRIKKTPAPSSTQLTKLTSAEVQHLVRNLQVQQIELEVQNEELRAIEAELAQSRDRYLDLFEFAPVPYITVDKRGRFLDSNMAAATMLRLERKKVLGANLEQFINPSYQDACRLWLRSAFKTETAQVCEIEMRRADGACVTVRLQGLVFGPKEDRCCLTALIDVSARKRAGETLKQRRKDVERALHKTEDFRRMADQTPMMVWTCGTDKLCTWVNRLWLEFVGRTMEQQLGHGWSDVVHLEDQAQCLKTFFTSFDARLPCTMEYRVRRHDGQWRWVLDNGRPLYNEDGTFDGYIGSCIDITDRRQSEDALREREERLRAILKTVGDGIITIDRHGTIVDMNPATERIFGYPYNELVGQKIKLLIPDADDAYPSALAETLQGSQPRASRRPFETVGLRKNGSAFPIELSLTEIPELGLFTGIYRDISSRKQTEQQLDQYRNDLRTMASELMLTEERERQRIAEDLHNGVGQAIFRARMKLDRLSTVDPAVCELGVILQELGTMMNTMTFELSPPVLHKLGLRPALRSLARDMQQRYSLSVHIDDDGQDIPLDERAAVILFRSVRELLINVAKHAQTDRARVSLKRVDRTVQLEIADDGKGFRPEEQSRHIEGGHFGLFSVRERLEYIGGMFKIQSMPRQGTTVTLTAPLAVEKLSETPVLL